MTPGGGVEDDRGVPAPSVRLRRLARHWGLVFAVALVFLVLGMCVREKPRVVPASLAPVITDGPR